MLPTYFWFQWKELVSKIILDGIAAGTCDNQIPVENLAMHFSSLKTMKQFKNKSD